MAAPVVVLIVNRLLLNEALSASAYKTPPGEKASTSFPHLERKISH